MTTVTFLTEGKRIIGFDAKGHSGYSEEGSDIVCAAVTSAVRLVESTVNDVLGLAASVKVHERSGAVEFRLPGGLSATNENTCQALLTGLMLLFSELAGNILVRQRGTHIHPGVNVGIGSDDTLYAKESGVLRFERLGKDRKQASVYPAE